MNRFEGRTVLVTGAAGDIGQELAVLLAAEGANVAVFDRGRDLLEETVARCAQAGPARPVLALAVDQTSREAVEGGVSAALEHFGRIDGLFANAGYGKFASFLDQQVKEWDRHVAVNFSGTFHVCQTVARAMVEARQGGAIVINTSSGAQQHTDPSSGCWHSPSWTASSNSDALPRRPPIRPKRFAGSEAGRTTAYGG